MKKFFAFAISAVMLTGMLAGCGKNATNNATDNGTMAATVPAATESFEGTQIVLSDSGIKADGNEVTADSSQTVYVANDIVYYESGHDFKYGEGTEADAHTTEEAAAHTVVHITKAGSYVISGKLSKGQIAVDLGDGAEDDPNEVVTLILNNADISCEVAPAIIFYNVYECGEKDTETATKDVDTSAAGANVIIADGSVNNISGSYVARIYKPDSVVLNADGTEVEDAKKLHKYDAAFYSKMTMNVGGGKVGDGVLNINAENEGLDSELHLTINGGNINIVSGNDGINTNEDGVSVTTVNGGSVNIFVDGKTGEGDGIDSNGWLVINGGSVTAQACAFSGDAGIDSDMGIHICGGKVFATGNMLDRISESKQNYAVFSFAQTQQGGTFSLKNSQDTVIAEKEITNGFTYLIISDEALAAGDYTLWKDDVQLQGAGSENMGGGMRPDGMQPEGMQPDGMVPPEMPEGMTRPEMPEGMEIPEDFTRPEMPEGFEPPEGFEDMPMKGERPDGMRDPNKGFGQGGAAELSAKFAIKDGGNYFTSVTEIK
ncbi:MAG: carbohydrate-binding domain-containing protein [Clostridia bacterium]|nr:carbohydrate-binding domain-containing protein [Clostridia bacterium]